MIQYFTKSLVAIGALTIISCSGEIENYTCEKAAESTLSACCSAGIFDCQEGILDDTINECREENYLGGNAVGYLECLAYVCREDNVEQGMTKCANEFL